ncbi:MAG: sulfoxide reductase heme-binding subunit YedZ [Gammaproteobacteria bacterium]|jgi:sulfoxide reductase heme-binding subunit YedZ|nr:sulfoxide reductase heme-binding subunit YedZ [Gammaproteobacteria bacterium]MBT6042046.1 sulfoxide reductase heme-binding subunit YedZ [Gammaproteobacteria bacterium]
MTFLAKPAVFLLCLLPGAYLAYAVYLAFSGGENLLGPDPAQFLSLETGEWAIRLLILSLAITPLRYLLNWPYAFRFRRMIGLFAYFYVCMHLLVFLMFLLQWQWGAIGREIAERPFITIGFAGFVLLTLLALTSFNAAQRKLGRNWKRLHRLTYAASILGVMHVIWIVRSSYFDAVLYGSLVLLLLGYRLLRKYSEAVRKFSILG